MVMSGANYLIFTISPIQFAVSGHVFHVLYRRPEYDPVSSHGGLVTT
jgi:hypothetical protein